MPDLLDYDTRLLKASQVIHSYELVLECLTGGPASSNLICNTIYWAASGEIRSIRNDRHIDDNVLRSAIRLVLLLHSFDFLPDDCVAELRQVNERLSILLEERKNMEDPIAW